MVTVLAGTAWAADAAIERPGIRQPSSDPCLRFCAEDVLPIFPCALDETAMCPKGLHAADVDCLGPRKVIPSASA